MSQNPAGWDYWFGSLAAIEGAVTSAPFVVPEKCRVKACIFQPDAVIAGTGAVGTNFLIKVEGTSQTLKFNLPESTPADFGFKAVILNGGATDAKGYLNAGEEVTFTSDALQILACDVIFCLITEPV